RRGRDDGRSRSFVRDVVRALKFLVQCRGEQNAFGKFTKFHGSHRQRASWRAEWRVRTRWHLSWGAAFKISVEKPPHWLVLVVVLVLVLHFHAGFRGEGRGRGRGG